ncbi:MAG: hypothetical protein ACPGJV_12245 [Bacteriovoracaceae bacterium]
MKCTKTYLDDLRPNLPWGLKVPGLNKNLKRNIKLISKLKDDPEEYVRKSVANHLNDISHLDENLMLKTAKSWANGKISKERQWVVRHATRTLLKKGHPEALKLHGYNPKAKLQSQNIKLNKKTIKEGDDFVLSFNLKNKEKSSQKVIIDYVIHYLKKDGSYTKKPFRLKDFTVDANKEIQIEKRITFKKVTTRKHYKGEHHISLQINGLPSKTLSFALKL